MPFDAAAPRRRYSILMPWRGRNAEILARRYAPPRLPPNWGASFVSAPRCLGTLVPPAPAPEDMRTFARGASEAERLLNLLHALAQRGAALPRIADLAAALDIDGTGNRFYALLSRLYAEGVLRRAVGAGSHIVAVMLVETGQVLRRPDAPEDMRWL